MGVVPTDEDLVRYEGVLSEIDRRLGLARAELARQPHSWPQVEIAALHLRKCLESLVFGSLIAHREILSEVEEAFRKHDHEKARKVARGANPSWFPTSIKLVVNPFTGEEEWNDRLSGALTEKDWGPAYGRTSELLHAKNPYGGSARVRRKNDLQANVADMTALSEQLALLLQDHAIEYPDGEHWMQAAMVGEDGRPWAGGFMKDPNDWRRQGTNPRG